MALRKPKLPYLVTEDWYFLSHRLPLAKAAREAGFETVLATRVDKGAEQWNRIPMAIRSDPSYSRSRTKVSITKEEAFT